MSELIGDTSCGVPIGEVQNDGKHSGSARIDHAVGPELQREDHERGAERTANEREPETLKVFPPDREDVRSLAQRDDDRDGKRVQEEVEPRKHEQPWANNVQAERMHVERLDS